MISEIFAQSDDKSDDEDSSNGIISGTNSEREKSDGENNIPPLLLTLRNQVKPQTKSCAK